MSEATPAPPFPYRLTPEVARRVRATAALRSRRRTALVVAVARAELARPRTARDPRLD